MFKKTIILLYCSFCTVVSTAQNKHVDNTQVPLQTILFAMEKEHNIKFSYSSKLIQKIKCNPFSNEKTLEEKLNNLSKQTNLQFTRIDIRYITIKEKEVTKNHTICGVLIDTKTKEPIAFSSVFVEGTLQGTTSDEKGTFSIRNIASNQYIKITSIGYKELQIPAYKFLNQPCLTLTIEEDNYKLEEVLISDYITQGISKKQNGGIQVSPAKLGILPGLIEPDVLLSLQLLPGIQSPSETASGLQIRGSTPDQNLVLFDGIKMFQSGHFFGLISSFNPYVTKKISLFRNGTSAKFGDRIGGVLDISSGDDVPEFESGFGINFTHADAYIKAPLLDDKVGIVFSARRSITDWVETITYKNFSESVFQNTRILDGISTDPNKPSNVNNDFYFKDYNLKVVAKLSNKDELSISNLFNKNELDFSLTNERFRETLQDHIAYQNKGTRIHWKQNTSTKFSQSLDLHTSTYDFDYLGTRDRKRNNPADDETKQFEVQNYVDDFGVNYDASYKATEHLLLSGGYQYSNTDIFYLFQNNFSANNPENKLLSDENSTNVTNAVYSEIKYQKNSNTSIGLGLRANHFSSVNEWFIEPRMYASAQITDSFLLKTSGEIKNQAVSQIVEHRNNGVGLENNVWAVSNGVIPILNSKQISVGFLYRNNGWNLDVDFYKKKVTGQTLMTDDIANQSRPYIFGESDITGVDVLLKKRFGNYRSWISYSYSNMQQQFKELNNGNSFNGIDEIPHSLTWSHTYKMNQFEFSLGWKLRSGVPYTEAIGRFVGNNNNIKIDYADVNAKRLPNYEKVDFSSTYKFNFSKNKKVEGKIGLSLLNIFNKKNILDRIYELKYVQLPGNLEELKVVETDKISLGFTPNVVFRVTF